MFYQVPIRAPATPSIEITPGFDVICIAQQARPAQRRIGSTLQISTHVGNSNPSDITFQAAANVPE